MTKTSHKHWIVLAVLCGLAASSIGISINSSGVFYTPVAEALGLYRGSFSLHMTIFSMVTALSAFFIPKIMEKISYKRILVISCLIAVAGTALMALTTHLVGFYVLGALRGLATSFFSIVPLTLIINQWFVEKHGLATSLVFGFSGLAGSICSPILSYVIEQYGWQIGYLVKAVILLVLCLPAMLYPFHTDPTLEGLKPYGYQEAVEKKTASSSQVAVLSLAMILFLGFSFLASCLTSLTQHFPGYGESLGLSATLSTLLLSAGMVGNIVSKLVMGVLSDWMGALKANVAFLGIIAIGVLFMLSGSHPILLLAGAFLFGSGYAIGAVGLPLLTKAFFSAERYARIFPYVSFMSNLGAALSLSLVGYIYDIFGSYFYAFWIGLGMLGLCLILVLLTYWKNPYRSEAKSI